MKKISLAHVFPIFVTFALQTHGLHAEEAIRLDDLTHGDPFYYTSDQDIKESDAQKALLGTGRPSKTHSQIPHLPAYTGYMSTNYTYRFLNVAEQVFTMIGEGKHGLWRVQESGTVREYLKKGASGLPENVDLSAKANLAKIESDYAAYLPEEGWTGYKYPDEKLNKDGKLNFIDLPITHAKYKGEYAKHEPIELPNWYCTMSENDYPYAKQVMNFAFNQPGANQIGPLGKRAGLDVKENYTKVLRLKQLPDARSWVNVGQPGKDATHVRWEAIDTTKTSTEYYLVERPFFNKPYLFVTAVYDNKDNADQRYVRPEGAYYDSIKNQGLALKTSVTQEPRFHLENGGTEKAVGLPVFGVHHPNRAAFGGGGACPLKGGDYARYPKTTGGAGWPTQYEEVTPLCDSVLVDIKFYSNLDGRDWNDANKYLANAGVGTKTVNYKLQPGEYGVFTDSYNVKRGVKNAESKQIPSEVALTFPAVEPVVTYVPTPNVDLGKGMVPAKGTTCRAVHE
jgi:hypothetical protein